MLPAQLTSAGGGGDLSSLVNPQKVRSSIKRLFQNSAKEILAELFQNAARALAQAVSITTSETCVIVADDGHGLLGGVGGFHTLLRIAESYFENETVADQQPMGLGVCALLSHDKVTCVTFASGSLALAIDTASWWTTPAYYESWFERLQPLDEPVAGLRITIDCDAEFVTHVRKALEPEATRYSHMLMTSAAQGYKGIIDITLDGKPVEVGLPDWARVREPLIHTAYQGCELTIGYSGDHTLSASSVSWYGQVIPIRTSYFQFCLEVRAGRPVNPRSPTRQGLIEDDAYHALKRFVADQVFAFLCDGANRERVLPKHVQALFLLDHQRALRECPYLVARPLLPLAEISSCGDVDQLGDRELFTYTDAPNFVAPEVMVVAGGEVKPMDSGLSSFLPMLGSAYTIDCGDQRRVTVRRLWWRPKGKAKHYFFHRPGEWGLGTAERQPDRWEKVTADCVFTFEYPDNTDFTSVNWTAGCLDILNFLNKYAWAGFNPDSDDRGYDDIQFEYEESVTEMVRKVTGRCVRREFRPTDLPPFFTNRESPIAGIQFHYRKQVASAITVKNRAGESVRLRLL